MAVDRDGGGGRPRLMPPLLMPRRPRYWMRLRPAARAAFIERRISDESWAFRVWVSTVTVEEELPQRNDR